MGSVSGLGSKASIESLSVGAKVRGETRKLWMVIHIAMWTLQATFCLVNRDGSTHQGINPAFLGRAGMRARPLRRY